MPRIRSFRDLEVWTAAMDLALCCYQTSDTFPRDERYTLTAQLRRAAVSIPANVAEGHNRKSRKAYRNHISIALGSQAELETLLELATRLRYLEAAQHKALGEALSRTGQMLHGLWRSLKKPRAVQPCE